MILFALSLKGPPHFFCKIRHFHYYYFAFAFVIATHCSAISSRLLTVPWTCKERRPALRGVGSSWRRKTLKNFMNKDRNCKQIFLLHQEKGKTFLQRIKSFGQKMSRTWGSFTLTLFHKKMPISIFVKIYLDQNPSWSKSIWMYQPDTQSSHRWCHRSRECVDLKCNVPERYFSFLYYCCIICG